MRLVPEKFLGEGMVAMVARGHTERNGMTGVTVPSGSGQAEGAGVPPGFYRIEITKPGMDIPAKYNTDTTLGVEVCDGAEELNGVTLNLEF